MPSGYYFGCTWNGTDPIILKLNGAIWFGFIVANLVVTAGYLWGIHNTGIEEARRAVAGILDGPFKVNFWLGIIVIGAFVPLIMYLFGNSPALLAIKAILVLIGCAIFRNVFLQAAVRKHFQVKKKVWMSTKKKPNSATVLKKVEEKAEFLFN